MITTIIDVTPGMAVEWLRENAANRVLTESRVDILAESMRNGSWELRRPGITIGREGDLCDGQHRLSAIVKTGLTVRMYVATGACRWTRKK